MIFIFKNERDNKEEMQIEKTLRTMR